MTPRDCPRGDPRANGAKQMSEIRFRSDVAVSLVQHVGGDASVVAAAKVSVEGAESVRHLDADASAGLIRYLMRQRHGTPFEHASMTFLVEAPIFVFREWHRHRVGWSFNETSGRYRELEPVFWVPAPDRKLLPVSDYKDARPQFTRDESRAEQAATLTRVVCGAAWEAYREMLSRGIAKEVARVVLPVATYSSMYATCNPRSLMHFLSLRTHDKTAAKVSYPLWEIEQAARQCEAEFARLFPITHAAFAEFGRTAP